LTEYGSNPFSARFLCGALREDISAKDAWDLLQRLDVDEHSGMSLIAILRWDGPYRERIKDYIIEQGPLEVLRPHLLRTLPNDPVVEEIVLAYEPATSYVNSLVGSLRDPDARDVAIRVLTHWGPSNLTLGPLVATVRNQDSGQYARLVLKSYIDSLDFTDPDQARYFPVLIGFGLSQDLGEMTPTLAGKLVGALMYDDSRVESVAILSEAGPSRTVVHNLVASLGNLRSRDAARQVLLAYGPSLCTVRPLLYAAEKVVDSNSVYAKEILVAYGPRALRHMHRVITRNKLSPESDAWSLYRELKDQVVA
jgi:hypothetical protein